jgi:hypothetical protein
MGALNSTSLTLHKHNGTSLDARQIPENNSPLKAVWPYTFPTPRIPNSTMSRRLFSQSLLRGIFEETRKTRMLMNSHRPPPSPASESRSMSTFRLPDVRAPDQYLIGMGIRPALARHLSRIYMDTIARYRQVFESYFRRAIQGSCHLRLEHYRDIFVVQFKGTVKVLESQFMSVSWVWRCQAGLSTLFWPQCIDVKIPIFTTFFTKLTDLFDLGTRGCRNESSYCFETGAWNNIVHYGCGWFKFYRFF